MIDAALRTVDRQRLVDHLNDPGFSLPWKIQSRTQYLKDRVTGEIVETWLDLDLHRDYIRRNRLVEQLFIRERIGTRLRKIIRYQGEMIYLRRLLKGKTPDITPDMIERARQFPFDQLYEFKRNRARCPFHEDRTPSLSLHNNRATCFGACSKTWDTISFVMEREGLEFRDAVRQLQ